MTFFLGGWCSWCEQAKLNLDTVSSQEFSARHTLCVERCRLSDDSIPPEVKGRVFVQPCASTAGGSKRPHVFSV